MSCFSGSTFDNNSTIIAAARSFNIYSNFAQERNRSWDFFLSETLTVLASLELCGIIALAHGFVNHSR